MSANPATQQISADEYLAIDDARDVKIELVDGELVMFAGAGW